ncbi:hypothetical protein RCT72_11320 [Escherichia marmotae]|uniref:hypothetical protein n=1 Tax=Escherichia whittamii TaxID=2762229 RepID=UPI002E246E14|nr:hypothetical protein [Escherichia whittamii]MEC9560383.1 hypothetical protein [Escherichia whittamii]MEC9823645.1 hypothetical protein [Escherichia marmotae]MED9339682.1 hypothetical protein [Escherichia marmotae]
MNTVALTYGNCSASVRIFSVVILTMHHTKRGSVYHLPFVVISTMQPSHRHAKGIYHYQLYPSNPPMVEKPTAGRPASPNGGFWNNQRVRPYQQKSTSTVTEIVIVAGGLNHRYGDAAM